MIIIVCFVAKSLLHDKKHCYAMEAIAGNTSYANLESQEGGTVRQLDQTLRFFGCA